MRTPTEKQLLDLVHDLCWALHYLPIEQITVTEADTVLLRGIEVLRENGVEFEPLSADRVRSLLLRPQLPLSET